jgi:hypothetical protein
MKKKHANMKKKHAKKKFTGIVAYPVYVTVKAKTQEEAEELMLEQAEEQFQTSSIDPFIHEISEVEE